MELLTIGSHFRIGQGLKIILGRNQLENLSLEGYTQEGYTCIRPKFAGPTALVVGEWTEEGKRMGVSLILQHTKHEKLPAGPLEFWIDGTMWTMDRQAVLPLSEGNRPAQDVTHTMDVARR